MKYRVSTDYTKAPTSPTYQNEHNAIDRANNAAIMRSLTDGYGEAYVWVWNHPIRSWQSTYICTAWHGEIATTSDGEA